MEVAGKNVLRRGNNLSKAPEVVFPGTAKRPKGTSGKGKRKKGETGDVGRGPSMQSLGGHNQVLVFILRTIQQPVVRG